MKWVDLILWKREQPRSAKQFNNSSISFQQINQSIKLFWLSWMIVNEMKKVDCCAALSPNKSNQFNQSTFRKVNWFHWWFVGAGCSPREMKPFNFSSFHKENFHSFILLGRCPFISINHQFHFSFSKRNEMWLMKWIGPAR